MNDPHQQLTIHQRPFTIWFMACVFLAAAGFFFFVIPAGDLIQKLAIPGILGLIGLAMLLFAQTLTITADRATQMLTLHSRSLFRSGSTREIWFSQIEAIQLEMNTHRTQTRRRNGRSRSTNTPTYRIVVIQKDGTVVPFSSVYSGDTGGSKKIIRQLREFIGVGGSEMGMSIMGTLREATKMAQAEYQKQQEELSGQNDAVRETDGVRWQVQTVAFGGTPVTRWYSDECNLPSDFVYLAQIAAGQGKVAGLFGNLTGLIYKQALAIYGFGEADLPGFEGATNPVGLVPELEQVFSIFTSDPHQAQRVLRPAAVAALLDWAQRYPLKTISAAAFNQLTVVINPQGTYVGSIGILQPEAIEEMARLGAALVRAQTELPEVL